MAMEKSVYKHELDQVDWELVKKTQLITRADFLQSPELKNVAMDLFMQTVLPYRELVRDKRSLAATFGYTAADIEKDKCDAIILRGKSKKMAFITVYHGSNNWRYLLNGDKDLSTEFAQKYLPVSPRFNIKVRDRYEGGRFVVKQGRSFFWHNELEVLRGKNTRLMNEKQVNTTMSVGNPGDEFWINIIDNSMRNIQFNLSTINEDHREALNPLRYKHASDFEAMLRDGYGVGVFVNGQLVSCAGIVETANNIPKVGKVGIIGNVSTLKDYRGLGLADASVAYLALSFFKENPFGFLIADANAESFRLFKERLGFEPIFESIWGVLLPKNGNGK